MKARIRYAKTGHFKFIGHLDMMRFFQKAIKRADLDIAYSQGFNPHQLMSFAAPLSLGISSDGEYFDADFHNVPSCEEMKHKLNAVMPEGVKIHDFAILPEHAKKAMSVTAGSDYQISMEQIWEQSVIEDFMKQDGILILKKTKRTEKEEDIKPFIYEIKIEENQLYMLLSTGSENNVKPELVLQALCSFTKKEYNKFDYQIHRLDTYMWNDEKQFIPLIAIGTKNMETDE